MKSKSYIPSYNARLKLTQRNVKTPEKIIKTRKSIKNKLSNIKYFIDNDTQEIYNIDSDKNKVEKLLIKNLKQNRKIKIKNKPRIWLGEIERKRRGNWFLIE